MTCTCPSGDGSLRYPCPAHKYECFMAALEKLCREHKVRISVSMYDAIHIWDLVDGDEEVIHSGGIEDYTNRSKT